ncbi:hypothetical protein [Nocardia terpenica]|uniref:hypothetical protein n=1 Tax=Nocardia terpenica TaxID=455432 RepID=UPI00193366D9|nr:hypothetical protein [Nocardia terpenica]
MDERGIGAEGLRASRTAVLVCQARAVADGRVAVGRFGDSVARGLLREEELGAGLDARGWRTVSDVDQLTLARGLGISVRLPRVLGNGRVVVADR